MIESMRESLQPWKNRVASSVITNMQQIDNPCIDDVKLESNEEEKGRLMPWKELRNSPQKQNVENDNHLSQANDEASLALKQEHFDFYCTKDPDSRCNNNAESDKKESVLSCKSAIMSEKSSPNRGETVEVKESMSENQIKWCSSSGAGGLIAQSSQHNFTRKAEKLQPRRNIVSGVAEFHSDAGSPPFKMQAVDDGYNWRKYGQKFVRGNKFVRGYRCTYSSCQAKKQLERSNDGQTEVYYFEKHQHSESLETPVITTGSLVRPPETIELNTKYEADADGVLQQSNVARTCDLLTGLDSKATDDSSSKDDSSPESKRQKIESTSAEPLLYNKPYGLPRHIVQTVSEVDLVNDGYRWRKYGQKMVRGSPYPRSYYKCSNADCLAKKRVERASQDRKVVFTTYEGAHSHSPILPY